MTPAELRSALRALGLSQIEAAAALGRDNGTVSRWCRGVQKIPPEVALLLAAWQQCPELLRPGRPSLAHEF